jgi:DNA-binding CsgD family transcriptional regulator
MALSAHLLPLTERDKRLILTSAITDATIAQRLGISIRTVKRYRAQLKKEQP